MKRTAILLCLSLSIGAFGFVHKPKMPKPNVPEASQPLLKSLQKYQKVVPYVGRPKAKPPEAPLPSANLRAASIIAGASSFVAQNQGAGPSGRPADSGSPTKGPLIATVLGCGTFFSFWVAGKRQKQEAKKK